MCDINICSKIAFIFQACASTFGDIAKTVDGRTTEEQLVIIYSFMP